VLCSNRQHYTVSCGLIVADVEEDIFPYLLVNIGSGVSIIRVDGPGEGQYSRVSGSSVGGGTFWGLCRLLTGLRDFDEMLQLSMQGNNANVSGVWDFCGGRAGLTCMPGV
jgi:type II pantothenate kinase